MKQQMINESLRLYRDIDSCISRLLKARSPYDAEAEMKAFDQMEGLMVGTLQHLSYMIDDLKNVEFTKWIKVEDALPKYEETVMVACHYKDDPEIDYIFCHRTDRNEVLTDKNGFAIIADFTITHWMPIVPPKED